VVEPLGEHGDARVRGLLAPQALPRCFAGDRSVEPTLAGAEVAGRSGAKRAAQRPGARHDPGRNPLSNAE
jgi:hypothetical protein